MNLKKVRFCLGVCAILLAFALCGCGDKKVNENNQGPNSSVSQDVLSGYNVEKNEGRIKITAEEPATKTEEFVFEVSPYQILKLKTAKEENAGFIRVDVRTETPSINHGLREFLDFGMESEYELTGAEEGKYTISFDMENFVGSYELIVENAGEYKLTEYVSDNGYKFSYVAERFDISNDGGKETFKLKQTDEYSRENGELYVSFYKISAANKEKEIAAIKEDADMVGDCYFDDKTLTGEYASKDIDSGFARMTLDKFMLDLNDGSVLVIERRGSSDNFSAVPGNTFLNDILKTVSYEQ